MQACKQVQPSHCLPGRKEGRNGEGRKDGREEGKEGRKEERGEVAFHGTYEWQRRRSIGRSAVQSREKRQKRDGRTD